MARNPGARIHYASTKAPRRHTEARFRDGDYIMFGKESRGLPESLLWANYDRCIRVQRMRGRSTFPTRWPSSYTRRCANWTSPAFLTRAA